MVFYRGSCGQSHFCGTPRKENKSEFLMDFPFYIPVPSTTQRKKKRLLLSCLVLGMKGEPGITLEEEHQEFVCHS